MKRTWSVTDGRVKRRANNGDIITFVWLNKAFHGLQVRETGDTGESPLDVQLALSSKATRELS